ncbi:MAG: hypothetical protein ACI37Z_09380 [Candidatus Gastranaerophilaceae bacterium]
MEKIKIDQLVIEMGRWCTMCCAHCLKGEREKKTNPFSNIVELLNQVESINSITFSGGEPFLYANNIIKTINYIMDNNIQCCGFYIATNGSVINSKLMYTLCKFYIYCSQYEGFSAVEVSRSPWHEYISEENEMFFNLYKFCSTRDEHKSEGYLIPEGRAQENGYGWKNLPKVEPKNFDFEDNTVEMLYLNSNGKCYPDCDLSYKTQENWNLKTNFLIPDINSELSLMEQINNYNDLVKENCYAR